MAESRYEIISLLSDKLVSKQPYEDLIIGLLRMCSDPALEAFDSQDDLKNELVRRVSQTDLKKNIMSSVYSLLHGLEEIEMPKFDEYVPEEPDWILNGRIKWLKRVSKGLESLSNELNIPPSKARSTEKQRELNRKWTDINTFDHKLESIRPIYAASDLYEACKSTVEEAFGKEETLSELNANIPVYSLGEMRKKIYGKVDFKADQLDFKNIIHCRTLLRSKDRDGELRPKLWQVVLQADVTQADRAIYEKLRRQVIENELISDKLLALDVRSTAGNDDFYFVFEDFILQTLFVFSRDEIVSQVSKQALVGTNAINDQRYPPSKVLPFYGYSFYCAPLCFLFHDPVLLFVIYKKIYLRYFIRLHSIGECPYYPPSNKFVTIVNRSRSTVSNLLDDEKPEIESISSSSEGSHSSKSDTDDDDSADDETDEDHGPKFTGHGLIGLAHQFESYFKERDPILFKHLIQIGSHPVRIAFRWLIRAFSGFLPVQEVLYLWDYILSMDSLEILPLFAVGVFLQRRDYLIGVTVSNISEAILSDLSTLKVEPVLELIFDY